MGNEPPEGKEPPEPPSIKSYLKRLGESLACDHTLFKDDRGKWIPHENIEQGGRAEIRVRKSFSDIWWYYANVIDYVRSVMAIIACYLIVNSPESTYWIAFFIMGSVLLDWVDGPVARYFGQSTTIGCGMDWLADLGAQFAIAVWAMQRNIPGTTFFVLFSFIEIATGLFDFAVSAGSMYPGEGKTENLPWPFIVEHWMTPNQTYSHLGVIGWLANTAWPIAIVLEWHWIIVYALGGPALLYAWHECVQLCFVVWNWKETTTTPLCGIEFMRKCGDRETDLLQRAWLEAGADMERNQNAQTGAPKKINWINMYVNQMQTKKSPLYDATHAFVIDLLKEMYPGQKRVILSYGFIVSPKNGEENQGWHYDYGYHVSNLFIPMTPVTHKNATQFIEQRIKTPMPESNYFEPPYKLMKNEGRSMIKVSQVVTDPFVVLKLFPSTCHRGIANKDDYDRVMFFISTNRDTYINIEESVVYSEALTKMERLKDD